MHLLILAGTFEAHGIATGLVGHPGLEVTISLARNETPMRDFGWPLRVGGFGGETGFRDWLVEHKVTAIIDATHPFSERMPHRSARVARLLGIPHVRVLRPPWSPAPNDNWTFLTDPGDAALHIPRDAIVFLATGRRELSHLSTLAGRRILCRVRSKPGSPFPISGGRFLFQPGPFTVESEMEFFREEGVDWIVTRNTGGQGAWPKLEAARRLGLPVALIRRPRQPECDWIDNVSAALDWVGRKL